MLNTARHLPAEDPITYPRDGRESGRRRLVQSLNYFSAPGAKLSLNLVRSALEQ
jgi:hypothetical protein